ncbi:MAG TPA: Flp family type IVb pilin [Actinomycetota bacterium]|jgi:pilus assembly protein Flp/PilA|nr:Flp family type IVb pilin [Actinomycetota bacterium]
MGKWEASRGGEQMQQALCRMWFDIVNRIHEIRDGERGATAVEYGIMIALIAAVIISVVSAVGNDVKSGLEEIDKNLP